MFRCWMFIYSGGSVLVAPRIGLFFNITNFILLYASKEQLIRGATTRQTQQSYI